MSGKTCKSGIRLRNLKLLLTELTRRALTRVGWGTWAPGVGGTSMQYERMWDHMSTGRAAVMVSEREEGGIMSDTLQLTLRQRLMSGNQKM